MNTKFQSHQLHKFILYLTIVVLINIVGTSLYFRGDLTSAKAYSLSRASKKAVSTLKEPLTVKVFFTTNLPAPYNGIERYLNDLLEEYALAGNRHFNFQFYDLSGKQQEEERKNQKLAENYGIEPLQIQNIKQDQVRFQKAYMGLVMIQGDMVETIPHITTTEGLEYRITSAIQKMNNKISALLSLKKKIRVTLFLSSSLQVVGPYMNLSNLSHLPGTVEEIVRKLNRNNYGKLQFRYLDPSKNKQYEEEAKKFQLLSLKWQSFTDHRGKHLPPGKGYAGLVVEHGAKSERINLIHMYNVPLFGTQYALVNKDALEQEINASLENLINVNEEIGYLADHGTLSTFPPISHQESSKAPTASNFRTLLSREYQLKEIHLKKEDIPGGLPLLIIAGPKERFTDYELYQIDQFLMKGRSLAIFLDPFKETVPEGHANGYSPYGPATTYLPIDTGLQKLLGHYGLTAHHSYVLDKSCFKRTFRGEGGGGEQPIYYAPIVTQEFINRNLPFMKQVKELVLFKASPVDADEELIKKNGLKKYTLLSSSNEAWEMKGRVNLNPLFLRPPSKNTQFSQVEFAYLLEGPFPSYFKGKKIPVRTKKSPENKEEKKSNVSHLSQVIDGGHPLEKGKPGKIFLIGTSEILTDKILSAGGKRPNDQFVMNIIDYLNGHVDNAIMRSKTQAFNPLGPVTATTRAIIKTWNIMGLPILVILSGVAVWLRRGARRRMIQKMFSKS